MTRELDLTRTTSEEASTPSRRLILGAAAAGATALAAPLATAAPANASTAIISASGAGNALWVARNRYAGRVPYVYGGMSPRGFDCSGMTKYLYATQRAWLPRSANDQYRYVRKISKSSARGGDLVFYVNSSGRAYHCGLYAGGDMMVDAGNPSVDISYRRIWYGTRVVFGTRRY